MIARGGVLALALTALIALVALGWLLPDWATFLLTMAFAKALVALGLVGLMRGGLVSFGQSLYYCVGAYVAALMANFAGVTDIFVLCLLAGLAALVLGSLFGPVLANYRGIFFAMLSLSLSMFLYGALTKMTSLGGTDGLTVAAPTFLGWAPEGHDLQLALYVLTVVASVGAGALMRTYFSSQRGLISLAIKDNELRVEYLGASVRRAMSINYVLAAGLAGLGGAISGLAIGHVDPELSYWTTSGEFVFVAILAGQLSIPAVFVGSVLVELVRSFSTLYFPNTWQLALGVFFLFVIFVLPGGLGSVPGRLQAARARQRA
jgi:ABC-type branched-subunit amino acid transport system permease subunit